MIHEIIFIACLQSKYAIDFALKMKMYLHDGNKHLTYTNICTYVNKGLIDW